MNRIFYFPAFLLLSFLYYSVFSADNRVLPWYYFPDGTVVYIGDQIPGEKIKKIYKINNFPPLNAVSVVSQYDFAEVLSEKGVHLVKTSEFNLTDLLREFAIPIFFSYVFLFAGVWFRHYGNDWHISIFCFTMSILIFLSIAAFTIHKFVYFWQVFLFSMPFFLLNVGYRVTGRNLNHPLLIMELILTIFIILVAYVGRNNEHTFFILRRISWYFLIFVSFLVSAFLTDELIKKHEDPIEKLKKALLLLGFFSGLFLPLMMFEFYDQWYHGGNLFQYPSFLFILFPATLLYGTYRIYLVPFQFVLTKSILVTVLSVGLISIYGIVLMAHSIFLPEQEKSEEWIVNLIFVLILVFFLDPAKRKLSSFFEWRFFRLSPDLTLSLENIASTLSSPTKSSHSVEFFINEIKKTLDLEEVSVLFSEIVFPQITLKDIKIFRIKESSNFWKYLLPDKLAVTSYLTYSGGSGAGLYRFLLHNNFYMALGISGKAKENVFRKNYRYSTSDINLDGMKAALLLGYKKDQRRYKLSEIRYLQEASRLATMMIKDYSLLIREIERRKKMRELNLAGQIQDSFTKLDEINLKSFKLSYFNLPAISVSGDYLDMIVLSPDRFVCLLGDVSGHGLGTGYLVSVVRSIVRSHLESGANLKDTFDLLNDFLLNRYQGHEYLTLLGFDINTETGEVEHINAAHPSPYLFDSISGEIRKISLSQKLLGALPGSYKINYFQVETGQRLFLYSDGVTETFAPDERVFGDKNLSEFLTENIDESIDVISVKLKDRLYDYRGGFTPSDDTTFLALEFLQPEPDIAKKQKEGLSGKTAKE
ncbi:MAG: serine/threonine-protein phosphatase [Spirochaetia bacterium]|nr:serine/threonine-protein phosphatase [Spirochaetia bacterium]